MAGTLSGQLVRNVVLSASASGVTRTGQLAAGSHVCLMMDDADDYASVAATFLAMAQWPPQRPVVFGPADSPAVAALMPLAALTADPFTEFLRGGPLDAPAMARVIREQTALARAEGCRGVLLVTDMEWLRPARPSAAEVTGYEAHLGRAAADLGATVICAYRRSSFPSQVITGALSVHSVLCGHGEEPQFRFTSRGALGWRLAGEVDFAVSSLFAAALSAAVRLSGCVIDLRELTFIDVSGVRVIARAAAVAKEPIELLGAPPVFRRYWELYNFGRAVPHVRFLN